MAQNLATQKEDASINYLIAAERGIIIFAQNILDIKVNGVILSLAEQQVLVMVSVFGEGSNQKAVDNGIISQTLQKALSQVFLTHLSGTV